MNKLVLLVVVSTLVLSCKNSLSTSVGNAFMVEEYLGGVAMDLHRGGRNESTFDPILDLTNNSFENVGNDKRNKENAAVGLHGVQLVKMNNLTFKNSEKLDLHFLVGEPIIKVENTSFKNSRGLTSNDDAFVKKNVTVKR